MPGSVSSTWTALNASCLVLFCSMSTDPFPHKNHSNEAIKGNTYLSDSYLPYVD